MDYWTIIISVVTAAIGWFSNKALTKREKSKSDIDISASVNKAIDQYLETTNKLMQRNEELHTKLLEREKEVSDLQVEREDLKGKIKCLENKLNKVTKRLNDLENEKNNVSNTIGFINGGLPNDKANDIRNGGRS